MLQLINIRKAYTTAAFTQVALDNVSVAFRDNEFAAILGPSGSGKTTLLNILGGLDHADSGDIVINGVSTKAYGDKDWDAYRNHRVGFIFQSYNLIPHQSVLANVELALTLAGVPAAERRERCLAALGRVGLSEHADKRPNQLSGGQMQRVAIARALVNDPEIVLADEPTGALDTETGIQVMELLKEIARDRLVVMVTHNPELAEEYATRIIRLKDGVIVDDTNPIVEGEGETAPAAAVVPLAAGDQRGEGGAGSKAARTGVSDATRHASMSFLTALSLSFNNLMTKKGRTFMTAFAGSIGIIGIAAILALSNGVNDYIARTEEEALSSYPLTITKSSFDLAGLMAANMGVDVDDGKQAEEDATKKADDKRVIKQTTVVADRCAPVTNNDLKAVKACRDGGDAGLEP
ncbi:MAG: ABC transporter ATP-binding protein, partial [Atopobiaceae bacterium]|nr:ABC transporter ATP-binding protein [Atopobiaceae bacterium]